MTAFRGIERNGRGFGVRGDDMRALITMTYGKVFTLATLGPDGWPHTASRVPAYTEGFLGALGVLLRADTP